MSPSTFQLPRLWRHPFRSFEVSTKSKSRSLRHSCLWPTLLIFAVKTGSYEQAQMWSENTDPKTSHQEQKRASSLASLKAWSLSKEAFHTAIEIFYSIVSHC